MVKFVAKKSGGGGEEVKINNKKTGLPDSRTRESVTPTVLVLSHYELVTD